MVMKETKPASNEETKKLYEELISVVNGKIKEKNIDFEHVDIKEINTQIEKIIGQLRLGNEELLRLALIKEPNGYEYPSWHSVNSFIFSMVIGLALGYDNPKLMELGIAAIFYDIGLCKYADLVKQPRKLTVKEHGEVKNHIAESVEITKKIYNDLPQIANDSILQHHERLDGSGYPAGIKEESINEYAKILSVADMYEAMMHPRPHRPAHPPLQTVKEFINNKECFDRKIIKILIERIGVFPLGYFVELNTKEKAEVVKINKTDPLSPVIKIIYGADGEKLEQAKIVDLAAEPNIFIKQTVQ